MEEAQVDDISVVKAEPQARGELDLEANPTTASGDVEAMDTDDLDESEIAVIAVKSESESETSPKDPGGSGAKATTVETSDQGKVMEDPFAPLKSPPSDGDGDQVIDLSQKEKASSSETADSTSGTTDTKNEKSGSGPWPVMLTPAGPPAFPSPFPVFPGMSNPPVGYMMHSNNLPNIAKYDTYLAEARERSMKEALGSKKKNRRRGRSRKENKVEATTGKQSDKVEEKSKSGRRKSAAPRRKEVDEDDIEEKLDSTFECQQCNKTFITSSELEKHEKSHSKYPCDSCDQAFGTKTALKQHAVTHERDLTYECHYCNKVFVGKWRYEKHVQIHGDEAPYKCVLCQERFVDWRTLNAHEKTHEKPYRCLDCDETFEAMRALKKHSRTHTSSPSEQVGIPGIFKCSHGDCSLEFKKKLHLKRHEKEAHPMEYLCKHCGKTLKDRQAFEKHERRHLGEKPFMCKYCGKMFIDRGAVTRHERVHTREKPFKCKICDKGFASSSAVKVHVRSHTGETPFPCKFCGKKFSTQSSVYLHLRIHSDTRDFKCTYDGCGKEFRQKAALIMHERRHTGERPFKCKFCMKGFTENRSLIRHERLHTGEKPFVCKYCGKAVTDQSTLTRHEHSHSDIKRFQCSYCDKRFTWHQHQLIHELLHTGEKPHKCKYCDKRFVKKANLTEHERIHTGAKPYKCRHCDKAFNQRGACRTHEHTHMASKPYKCEKCDKSFSWRHLLVKHEQTHFDVNAPLEMHSDEEEREKSVKVPQTEQKVKKNVEKLSSTDSKTKVGSLPVPGAKDPEGSFDRGESCGSGQGSNLNARCQSLADTVSALHQSIVSALVRDPVRAANMNPYGPNATNQIVSGSEGQDIQRGHLDPISSAARENLGPAVVPCGPTADIGNQSHSKSLISHQQQVIPTYNQVMNMSPQKDMGRTEMPRVMCSPTQRLDDPPSRPCTYRPLEQALPMTGTAYVQGSQMHSLGSNRLAQSPESNVGHPGLIHHEHPMDNEAYVQHEHIIGDPAYEQVINNEVEVTATSDNNVTDLHQQISHIMTAFNQNLDNSANRVHTLPDNSKVIILSVPKP